MSDYIIPNEQAELIAKFVNSQSKRIDAFYKKNFQKMLPNQLELMSTFYIINIVPLLLGIEQHLSGNVFQPIEQILKEFCNTAIKMALIQIEKDRDSSDRIPESKF